jgi:hypothetical protein
MEREKKGFFNPLKIILNLQNIMNNSILLNQLEGISHSIKDPTLHQNFTITLDSLKKNIKSMEEKIEVLVEEVLDLEFSLDESENSRLKCDYKTSDKREDNVFGTPKTLEEKMKMELLYEIYKKYSLTQIEEKIGNKYNLVF